MEMGRKHAAVIVYLWFLLYVCSMVPFVLQKDFYEQTSYVVAMTICGALLTMTSLVGNGMTCYVMMFCTNSTEENTNFLFVLISIADLFLPFLRYPIEVADLWIFKEKLYETNINYNPFKKATARLAASHHGVAATSTLAFALICIIRFFQVFGTSPSTRRSFSSSALPRREQFHVNNKWKIALTLMLAGISLLVGIVNYKYAEEEWFHAFQAPLVLFFPLFVMASTLFSAFLKTEFSTSARAASQGENTGRLLAIYCTFLSYLLLWTPSFAVDMLHGYCCTFDWVTKERVTVVLDNLLHFKTCLNAVFLYTCDAQFRSVFEATARQFGTSFLCCFFDSPIGGKNIGFEHTVNDSDISVRYTVNDEDMMIDMEQQALVA